ncbi:MAG TPA: VOC family protein [Caldimonas sp.]
MPQAVQNPPQGYHTLTPYMTVRNARAAIDFYKKAFGAEKVLQLDTADGTIAHAEIRIGDSVVMLSEENEAWGTKSPLSLGGSPMFLMAYVADVDAAFRRAIDAGAAEIRPVADQFYGDRSGTLKDPYGHQWTLSTHIEDVSEAEAQKRMEAEFAKS